MLFDIVNSRRYLSGPTNNGQRFVILEPVIHTEIGREELAEA